MWQTPRHIVVCLLCLHEPKLHWTHAAQSVEAGAHLSEEVCLFQHSLSLQGRGRKTIAATSDTELKSGQRSLAISGVPSQFNASAHTSLSSQQAQWSEAATPHGQAGLKTTNLGIIMAMLLIIVSGVAVCFHCYTASPLGFSSTAAQQEFERKPSHCTSKQTGGGCAKADILAQKFAGQGIMVDSPSLKYAWWDCCSWLRELHQTFGFHLLILVFAVQHLLKGFTNDFSNKAVPYMFKYYSVPAPQAQVFISVTGLPWGLKPLIGLISDTFPIWGYNKAPYMAASCILGVASFACLGSATADTIPVVFTVVCLLLWNVQLATCDLLAEAKYSAEIRLHPSQGPSLSAYVWFGLGCGVLVSVGASGVILQYAGYQCVFLICMVPTGFLLFPLLAGYTQEPQMTGDMKVAARQRFVDQPEICVLSFIMAVGTLIMAVAGIAVEHVLTNAILAVIVAVVVLIFFSVLLTPSIAKFNAFCLISSSLSFSIHSASFYFYTDTFEQYPGGPHFSKVFYNSVLGGVATVCSLLGIWSYKCWFSTWRFRSLVILTSLILAGLNLLDVILFTRANVKYLGIPDKAFLLGSTSMESVVAMWGWMAQVLMFAQLAPKGMEATMYGLLAACNNLGNTVGANVGALMLEFLEVQPKGATDETAMFDKLWVASVVSTFLPLLSIISVFWLIPNKPQTECFTEGEADSPVSGSLWRQWMNFDDELLPADDAAHVGMIANKAQMQQDLPLKTTPDSGCQ